MKREEEPKTPNRNQMDPETPAPVRREPGKCHDCKTRDICANWGGCWPE